MSRPTVVLTIVAACSLIQPPAGAQANGAQRQPVGIAWRVQGGWQQLPPASRMPLPHLLKTGDAIQPGSLLRPAELQGPHSITLLLPDGQRILDECFTEEDCARGFRVPMLNEVPSAFAVRMLDQMRGMLARLPNDNRPNDGSRPSATPHTTVAKRDEALASIDAGGRVSVGGLLASLPNGDYTYDLRPDGKTLPARFHLPLAKTSAACVFPVPAPGTYDITIWDAQNTPRIQLFLAAIAPAQAAAFSSLPAARKRLAEWDEQYYGWPIHDLLRAYLRALMEAAQPSAHNRQISAP